MIYKKENRNYGLAVLFQMCGQRWIRTTEGESQQIYRLPELAALVVAHRAFAGAKVLR